jgi:cytochrome c oxidase subunit II
MMTMKSALFAIGLVLTPMAAVAQPAATAPAPVAEQAPAPVAAPAASAPADAPSPAVENSTAAAPAETTIGTSAPVPGIGQPVDGGVYIQPQVSPDGEYALWMHDWILMPVMVIMSLFVLALLLWASVRYRRSANPVASKTSHNTLIEVIWTLVPVLILVAIAVPSISLLASQFDPAPKNAVTLKVTGNQWFWSYEYPDHGVGEYQSNMLDADAAKARGEPRLLAVDNRVVLPVNTPIRVISTATDVIHSWAVPAFWVKIDSVPGRLNEYQFTATKTGVYYGQCSELCGIKHAYMPIAVEIVSKEDFATWVRAKGGKMPGDPDPAAAAAAPAIAPTAGATPGIPAASPATLNEAAPAPVDAQAATKN